MEKEKMKKCVKFITGNVTTWSGGETYLTEKIPKGKAAVLLALDIQDIKGANFQERANAIIDELF